MRRLLAPAILGLALTLVAACAPVSGSSSGRSSPSVRCLSPGESGAGAAASSESPDRPLLFFFCVQSP